jgi:hypothetical protein
MTGYRVNFIFTYIGCNAKELYYLLQTTKRMCDLRFPQIFDQGQSFLGYDADVEAASSPEVSVTNYQSIQRPIAKDCNTQQSTFFQIKNLWLA